MNIDFTGVGAVVATFECEDNVTEAGQLVALSGSGRVGVCEMATIPWAWSSQSQTDMPQFR